MATNPELGFSMSLFRSKWVDSSEMYNELADRMNRFNDTFGNAHPLRYLLSSDSAFMGDPDKVADCIRCWVRHLSRSCIFFQHLMRKYLKAGAVLKKFFLEAREGRRAAIARVVDAWEEDEQQQRSKRKARVWNAQQRQSKSDLWAATESYQKCFASSPEAKARAAAALYRRERVTFTRRLAEWRKSFSSTASTAADLRKALRRARFFPVPNPGNDEPILLANRLAEATWQLQELALQRPRFRFNFRRCKEALVEEAEKEAAVAACRERAARSTPDDRHGMQWFLEEWGGKRPPPAPISFPLRRASSAIPKPSVVRQVFELELTEEDSVTCRGSTVVSVSSGLAEERSRLPQLLFRGLRVQAVDGGPFVKGCDVLRPPTTLLLDNPSPPEPYRLHRVEVALQTAHSHWVKCHPGSDVVASWSDSLAAFHETRCEVVKVGMDVSRVDGVAVCADDPHAPDRVFAAPSHVTLIDNAITSKRLSTSPSEGLEALDTRPVTPIRSSSTSSLFVGKVTPEAATKELSAPERFRHRTRSRHTSQVKLPDGFLESLNRVRKGTLPEACPPSSLPCLSPAVLTPPRLRIGSPRFSLAQPKVPPDCPTPELAPFIRTHSEAVACFPHRFTNLRVVFGREGGVNVAKGKQRYRNLPHPRALKYATLRHQPYDGSSEGDDDEPAAATASGRLLPPPAVAAPRRRLPVVRLSDLHPSFTSHKLRSLYQMCQQQLNSKR